jgi:hypothetical protein
VRKSPRIRERRTNHLTRKFVDEMSEKARSSGELISETPGTNLEEAEPTVENQKPLPAPKKAKSARQNS